MSKYDELLNELEQFKRIPAAEFELSKLEKWMFTRLGVERLKTGKASGKKKGQGSKRFYKHGAMESVLGDGNFVIHVQHKKHEVIYTNNFRKFAYHTLVKVIGCMKVEEERER